MKIFRTSGVLAIAVLALPLASLAFAEQGQQSQVGQVMETVQFPPSDHCTANQPCRTVMGEITRVEETYVIKQPNGSEIHVNVQPETNIQGLHKTGDKVAAQLSSRGVAHAVVKLKELPKSGLEAPGKTLEDLR
jgi:hypothetical protein